MSGIPNAPGDFGVKQIVRTRHLFDPPGPQETVIDDRTYSWNRVYNKTRRKDIRAGGPQFSHAYSYDLIYRLVRTIVTTPPNSVLRDERYTFDKAQNRDQVTGGYSPGDYACDASLPEPADCQMNQYTETPFDSREYDKNGNLVHSGSPSNAADILYDYRNRMVQYDPQGNGPSATYAYDPLGRRIEKVIVSGGPSATTLFLYDQWQVCEEQDAQHSTLATYVYGGYVDEILNMQRAGEKFWYHADDLHSVMALTDESGAVP